MSISYEFWAVVIPRIDMTSDHRSAPLTLPRRFMRVGFSLVEQSRWLQASETHRSRARGLLCGRMAGSLPAVRPGGRVPVPLVRALCPPLFRSVSGQAAHGPARSRRRQVVGRRRTPLAQLLARFGCPWVAARWRVVCRDAHGQRATLTVVLSDTGVEITAGADRWILSPLDVGRLRICLREAVMAYSELRSAEGTAKGTCDGRDRTAA